MKTPLTPIQKALSRLEGGGIITSYCEGKTRLYQFSPVYPLLEELEQLLRKAYTLLPPQEKKRYCFVRVEQNNEAILLEVWDRLTRCKQLRFSSRSKSKEESGRNGSGKGEVSVKSEDTDSKNPVLILTEKGSWVAENGTELDFSNVFRWTLDRSSGIISLEHLRHGVDRPVFLFHLAPAGRHLLVSMDSHLCAGDNYLGQIVCDRNGLRLHWRVIGPKKNEEIDYHYT